MDKGMLNDATSSDDSPVAGYLLQEIAKQTLGSYPACQQLEEFVLKRLEKDNHNIKFKCLMIIRHVCRSGRADFKKDMARFVQPIKDCLQFKGPPDPLRGDEIYKRVRDLAREALDAVFDSQMPVTTSAVAAQGRIQGIAGGYDPANYPDANASNKPRGEFYNRAVSAMGGHQSDPTQFQSMGPGSSNPHVGNPHANNETNANYNYGNSGNSGVGGAYSGSGFGNPNFTDPRQEKSWTERATEAASAAGTVMAQGMIASSEYLGINKRAHGQQGAYNEHPSQQTFNQGYPNGNGNNAEYQFRSNRGPGTVNGTYKDEPRLPGGGGKAWPHHMQPKMVPQGDTPHMNNGSSLGTCVYQ